MNPYVAFLRAINVGGHVVVKMAALEKTFTDAGCRNVKTVIQSGNVIFDLPDGNREVVLKRVQSNVDAFVGTETSVIFRTMNELLAMVDASPFGNGLAGDEVIPIYSSIYAPRRDSG